MVWSQHEGLSFQYVTSSVAEKKSCALWNNESFSIVISSPKCANREEASSSRDHAEADSSSSQLKRSMEEVTSDTIASSKENSVCKIHEKEPRTPGDLILSSREVNVNMQNLESDQPADKVDSSCDLNWHDEDAIGTMHDKDPVSGSHNRGQGAEYSSRNLKDLRPKVERPTDVGSIPKHMKVLDQMEICSIDHNLLNEPESPTKSSASSKTVAHENNNLALDRTVEWTSVKSLDRKGYGEGQFFDLAEDEQLRTIQKGKSVLINSPSVNIMSHPNTWKGKEKVIYERTQNNKSTSNRSEDSSKSVESSNSKRVISSGKRERSFNLNISTENKRLKRLMYEGTSSSSFVGRNSSFMNWVSTITDGFFKFSDATPLDCVAPPSHRIEGKLNYSASSQNEGKGTGFKSIFQSLCLPGCNLKKSTYSNSTEKVECNVHNLLRAKGEKSDSPSDYCSNAQFNNGDELHDEGPIKMEKLNQNAQHVKGFPSAFSTDSRLLKDIKCELRQSGGTAGSVVPACFHGKKGCRSPFEGKGEGKLVAVSESSPNSVSKERTLESLWITRFFPKVATKPNSMTCEGNESLIKDCDVSNPKLQNSAAQDMYYSSEQVQKHVMTVKNLESSDKPMVFSLKSQKAEQGTSSSAKRLDIL